MRPLDRCKVSCEHRQDDRKCDDSSMKSFDFKQHQRQTIDAGGVLVVYVLTVYRTISRDYWVIRVQFRHAIPALSGCRAERGFGLKHCVSSPTITCRRSRLDKVRYLRYLTLAITECIVQLLPYSN